jgi:hypothetical protein
MITIEKNETEVSEIEVNKIRAVKANLKTKIKDQAVLQKRAKSNNKEVQREVTKCGWNSDLYKRRMINLSYDITLTHILYNRLRNRPPHTGSVESDNSYMSTYGDYSNIKNDLESRFSISLGV